MPRYGARGGGGGDEALRAIRGDAVDRGWVGGAPDLRLLLARLAQPEQDVVRRDRRPLVRRLRDDLGPLPPGGAAALAHDRRAAGPGRDDRRGDAGRRDDPAGAGAGVRRDGPPAPGPDPERPALGELDALLDPGRRGPCVRRELLRPGFPGGKPAVRPLRLAPARRVHGTDVVRPRGRGRHRKRPDRRGTGNRGRAGAQPRSGAARVRRAGGLAEDSAASPGTRRRDAVHAGPRRRLRGRGVPDHGQRAEPPERRAADRPRVRGRGRGGLHLQRADDRPGPTGPLPGGRHEPPPPPHQAPVERRGGRRGCLSDVGQGHG